MSDYTNAVLYRETFRDAALGAHNHTIGNLITSQQNEDTSHASVLQRYLFAMTHDGILCIWGSSTVQYIQYMHIKVREHPFFASRFLIFFGGDTF